MNDLIHWSPRPGLSMISNPGEVGLKYLGFGILCLSAGQKHTFPASDNETALVLLEGAAAVSAPGLARQTIGPRESLYSCKPWIVYLPARKECVIEATGNVQIAVCQAVSTRTEGACLVIGPDNVKEKVLGKDSWQRMARFMVDGDVPAEFLFIGEVVLPGGQWASFPPHRHDKDELPYEVDMEEIYYFRFDRPQGFGIQKVYTDDRSVDLTLTVVDHDTVRIPVGYHPVAAAPGYPMYYLWIMAGKNRQFLSRLDPDHKWIVDA